MKSDLCVVIPNFNYAQYLEEAVASVLGQSRPSAQVIITDDGSTDESRAILAKREKEWPREIVSVRLFEHRGLVATLNTVLPDVRTRFFTVLAADDRWMPQLAAAAASALVEAPDATLWHCDSVTIDGRGERVAGGGGERRMPATGRCLIDLLEGRAVIKGAYVLPTEVVRAVGGFDSRFPNEDWALFLRAAARGRFLYDPRPLVERRVHGSNWSTRVWSDKTHSDPTRYSAPEVMKDLSPTPDVYRRALSFHLAVPVRQAFHAGHFVQAARLLRRLSSSYPETRGALVAAALKGIVGAAWRAGPRKVMPESMRHRLRRRLETLF